MNTPDPFQPSVPPGPTPADDYRTLLESFAQALWETDAQGRVVADSPSWRAYTGQSPEQVLGEGWIDAVHPDDRPAARQRWQEAITRRAAVDAELRLQRPEGGWRWTELRATPVLTPDGSVRKWLAIAIDISARKDAEEIRPTSQQTRLEQQLQESRTLQQAVFNTVSHAITVFEAVRNETNRIVDFRFILSNGVADQHMGIQTAGKTLRTVTPGYFDETNFATMIETVETGQPASRTLHFTYGETDTYLQTRYLKLNDGVLQVHEDITEHKKAETEILALKDAIAQNATDKYLTLFNNIQQGFAIVELLFDEAGTAVDYRFLEANPAMEQQSGLRDVVGKTMRSLSPGMEDDVYRTYGNVVITKQTVHFEKKATMPTGMAWFDTYAVSIGPADGNQLALLFTNITKRKQRELNAALLDQIGIDLASLPTPAGIIQMVCAHMGTFLQASGCFFNNLDDKQADTAVSSAWLSGAGSEPQPILNLENYLTEAHIRTVRAGETIVVDDTRHDGPGHDGPDAQTNTGPPIGSVIVVPYRWQGRWVAGVAVTNEAPRHWRPDEIELVQEIGGRLLARIERVRADDALRVSEERTRLAVEAAGMAIWEWDLLTNLVYCSEQYFSLLGQSPRQEPLNWVDFIERIYAPDRDYVQTALTTAIAEQTVYNVEFRVTRPDQTTRWMSGYGRVTAEHDDRPVQLSGMMLDITDRKEAEEALRDSQQRLQIVLDSVVDHAIITLDPQAVITSWNPGAEQLFGYPADEAIGQSAAIIFTPEDRATGQLEKEMQLARQSGQAPDERFHIRKDGSRLYISGVLSPLHDTAGQLLGYVKIARDLSDRRRMEQALRDTDRRKDEFLAMLAHELRNPLAPIRNGLQFLALTSEADQQLGSLLGIMNRQMDHLVRLVDDLLDVSRISRGRIELRREALDLTPVVGQAIEAIRPLYQANNRQLTVELPDVPLYLTGDATRLHQVVTNLLTNGVRYTPEAGQVWLSLAKTGDEAVLRVRDNGIGLTPDQISVIFELFVQVDNSLARSNGGLGLGLTLVQQLVEMHGGRVEAYSPGLTEGSEFVVYLPLHHA